MPRLASLAAESYAIGTGAVFALGVGIQAVAIRFLQSALRKVNHENETLVRERIELTVGHPIESGIIILKTGMKK